MAVIAIVDYEMGNLHSVCKGLEKAFGIVIDEQKNSNCSEEKYLINDLNSKIKLLVVAADEELSIAQQTFTVVNTLKL